MNNPLEYCQDRGLRILSVQGFQFFYNTLGYYPGNYLEIGVFEGFMLRELGLKYPHKTIYGIDPFIEDGNTTGHNGGVPKGERTLAQRDSTLNNIQGIPNIILFEETSCEFANRSDQELEKMNVSCVLVDGDHSTEATANDLELAKRLLVKGGVMYVDDADLPSARPAVDKFISHNANRVVCQVKNLIWLK